MTDILQPLRNMSQRITCSKSTTGRDRSEAKPAGPQITSAHVRVNWGPVDSSTCDQSPYKSLLLAFFSITTTRHPRTRTGLCTRAHFTQKMDDSSPSIVYDDNDTGFVQHTAAQRAKTRQTRGTGDELAHKPDTPHQFETDETDPRQEARGDGGVVVLYYKPATAAPGESNDVGETDTAADIADKS